MVSFLPAHSAAEQTCALSAFPPFWAHESSKRRACCIAAIGVCHATGRSGLGSTVCSALASCRCYTVALCQTIMPSAKQCRRCSCGSTIYAMLQPFAVVDPTPQIRVRATARMHVQPPLQGQAPPQLQKLTSQRLEPQQRPALVRLKGKREELQDRT